MRYVVAALIGYLLGSVPLALIVARWHGVNLRLTGDGNPGAWNALEQLGAKHAWPAFVGDGAKALVAGLAGRALGGWWVGWVAVTAAMVGHAFPVFAPRRGGKAVMCFAGGAFVLAPLAAGICLLMAGVLAGLKSPECGARLGVFAFPIVQLMSVPVAHVAASGGLMTFIGGLFLLRRGRAGRAIPARVVKRTGSGAAPPGGQPGATATESDAGARSCQPAART